jgi:hypothetical protein
VLLVPWLESDEPEEGGSGAGASESPLDPSCPKISRGTPTLCSLGATSSGHTVTKTKATRYERTARIRKTKEIV